MSETTTTTENNVEDAPKTRVEVTDAFDPMFHIYKDVATKANHLSDRIISASADEGKAVENVLNTSDDATISKWRAEDAKVRKQIEDALAKLEERKAAATEHAKTLVASETDGFDVDAAKAELLPLRAQTTQMRKSLLTLLNNDQQAFAQKCEDFGITERIGTSRGAKTTGATGIRRPRLSAATLDGADVEKDGKVSFTILASVAKVNVDDLKAAAFAAAGTDDLSTLNGKTVAFTFTTKQNGADVTRNFTVTPKVSEDAKSE